jgi:tetratricopeptide (TPR) repeat protein
MKKCFKNFISLFTSRFLLLTHPTNSPRLVRRGVRGEVILAFIIHFSLFTFNSSLLAQTPKIDSLKKVLSSLPKPTGKLTDSTYIKTLQQLAFEYSYINPDTATIIAKEGILLSEKINWIMGKIICLNELGRCCLNKGIYQQALEYYNHGLTLAIKISDNYWQAKFLGNIGNIYTSQSDYPNALSYYFKALKKFEELDDKRGIGINLGNIGFVYHAQSNYSKALDYYFKALNLYEELDDKRGISTVLGNIGLTYYDQHNYQKALEYYLKSLKIDEELDNKIGVARQLSNIGLLYKSQSNFTKALDYYLNALKINKELGNKKGIAINLGNIGELYILLAKLKEGEIYLKQALALSDSIGTLDISKIYEYDLYRLYDTLGQYKLALEHFKKYIAARDTIESEKRIKEQAKLEAKFEYEMKEMKAKAEQEKREIALKSERKRNKIIMTSLIIGLILVLTFSFYIWRSLNITKKQKEIIEQAKGIIERQKEELEEQKQMVENKNKDIMDSINYALRIQQAILPDEKKWNRLLPDSFKLYLPKDVLAGDFYWLEENESYIYVAAADCTGHGVPGAMVSVVCSSALTKAVLEDKLINTNEILDRVREIVIEKMSSNEGQLRDGMDVCLVRINKNNRKEIQYSGANRPLYIVKANGVLEELSPDKQPIGWMEETSPFKAENKVLEQGDMLYLTTDGFADQFGGPKNKKLKTKGMLELFVNVHSLPLNEQKEKIHTYYSAWKGSGDQTDDVCVIGIKM